MVNTKDLITLRKETQAPFLECKKCLEEAKGNLKKARELLKKKGFSLALKKKERATGNGIIEAYIHNNKKIGVLVEIGCETDFVARNKLFEDFAHKLAMQIASMEPKNVKKLLKQAWIFDEKETVEEKLKEVIFKTGENIEIKRFVRFEIGKI